MLLKMQTLRAVAVGHVDLAFRRWRRPTVRAGGRLRTAVGVLAIHRVERVTLSSITVKDARRAGFESKAELLAELRKRTEGDVYRIELRLAGPDERLELRETVAAGDALKDLVARLERIDRASRGEPWTKRYLELIAEQPGVRAPDLAELVGLETRPFKARVRRLKELGLTESLKVGYRLAPRGRSVLKKLR